MSCEISRKATPAISSYEVRSPLWAGPTGLNDLPPTRRRRATLYEETGGLLLENSEYQPVSVSRRIEVPAGVIAKLLEDPVKHPPLGGSRDSSGSTSFALTPRHD